MRTRLGLALSRDAIRAVAVRRHRIVWAAEATIVSGVSLEAAISSLFEAAPLPRFPKPLLAVAVGPHASQVRLVAGLPESQNPETTAAIIRENAGSFFLKNGVPLLTTGVQSAQQTSAFAASIDQPCVDAVRHVCRNRGWPLFFIAPSVVCLPLAVEDRSFVWADAGLIVDVTHNDGKLESIRTRPLSTIAPIQFDPPHPRPRLATLGDNAVRFADAYGAAVTARAPLLAVDAVTAGLWTWRDVRRRLVAPTILLALGLTGLVLSPLSAVWAGHRAQQQLSRIRDDQLQTVVSTLGVLDRTTAILEEVRAFAGARPVLTDLLGELAAKLPRGTIIISLQLTDSVCQLEALSPSSADVLRAVGRLPHSRSVELLGPVQHETAGGRDVQRVTVRWSERTR